MTVTVSVPQRRARLVDRHRLAAPADSVVGAADAMIALHGTDPTAVYLSAWARTGCAADQVDEAIYVDRSLVRMLGMRRTMFVVPAGLVPVVQAACTDDVAKRLRRQLEKDLAAGGVGDGDPGGWLQDVGRGVLEVLHAREGGGASAAQLSEGEPRLRTQLFYAPDKSYGGVANITSRVLMLLGAEGHLVRGHRRGGWSSGQYNWFAASSWLSGQAVGAEAGQARVELARRWLRAFGPAPVSDLQWWSGWTGGQTKAALAALPVAEVSLDGQPGVALADDLEFADEPAPAAALLPGLDPTPMGWQARDWFLGPHRAPLFDRTGNIGPTIWWQGRVVGGWAQRGSGEIALRLLEDIGTDGAAAVSAQAARLEAWLGADRVTPRFRTPLERELTQ
ncbi:MAG TPA: winged helix DNA-binding domain-containing protein [Trebonia sp.]|nr:winged helix DNA-binding domain-containing protein [Trebonia sp.]